MEEWVMWSMCMVRYKNVFEVKYLWIVVTNQNYLHKEITNSLNLGIACQYSVHIALFPMSYLKTSVFKIYRNYAVPCFMWVWWYVHPCNRKVLDIQGDKEIITNEELHNLSSSLNITWVITLKRMTWWAWTWWACDTYERVEDCWQYFIRKPEGIIIFGRSRYRWKNDFKTGVLGFMCEGVLD